MSLTQWARRQALALSQSAVIRGDSQAFRDAIFALTSRNNYADAEFLVEKREEALGTSPFLLWLRASLQAHQDKAEEALKTLTLLFREAPQHAQAMNLAGVLYSSQQEWEKSRQCFEKANSLAPEMTDTRANLGWTQIIFDNAAEANRHFRHCLSEWLPSISLRPLPPQQRLDLSSVTLCCIDTAYHDLAAFALQRSMDLCNFDQVLFFTDRPIEIEGIRTCQIHPLSSREDYSNFVIHQLPNYIHSDYVLISQYDGFILHPQAWRNDFLAVDYLGPPTFVDEQDQLIGCNGGFSLRSKRLLEALSDKEIAAYDANTSPYQEDLAICKGYRGILEGKYGIRFPDYQLATAFATELTAPSQQQFGFHNCMHLMQAIQTGFDFPTNSGSSGFFVPLVAPTAIGLFQATAEIVLSGRQPQS